jgi:hypothetical protein
MNISKTIVARGTTLDQPVPSNAGIRTRFASRQMCLIGAAKPARAAQKATLPSNISNKTLSTMQKVGKLLTFTMLAKRKSSFPTSILAGKYCRVRRRFVSSPKK